MATAQNALHKHRLSVHDYHRMGEAGIFAAGERVELIDGEVIDMSPIGSQHAGTVILLTDALKKAVGEEAVISVQNPIVLGDYSEPEPDIVLLRPRADFYRDSHPGAGDILLVIEVADSSLQGDREAKVPLYAHHGIPEAWLIDTRNSRMSIFHTPVETGYQQEHKTSVPGLVKLQALPEVTVDLSRLF
ncbi:MAG: Uma2 family endonuclease [Gammaproteobacteria bacterium]